jgi:glycerate kinase
VKICIAPDSFKGTLSSQEAAACIARAARRVFPGVETVCLPMADGGEGTAAAMAAACGGRLQEAQAAGPLAFDERRAEAGAGPAVLDRTEARPSPVPVWAALPNAAVIEMAQAAGLPLVPEALRDPRYTTTYGVGQLLVAALDAGYRDILLALGGSATNDGGLGLARALGLRALDGEGRELRGTGADLARVAALDLAGLDPRLKACRIRLLCDVRNPPLGPEGAAAVFGPQKGATPEVVAELERGMANYIRVVEAACGRSMATLPGAGAAGGLGVPLLAFCGAELVRGVDAVLDAAGFESQLADCDLVVTGEGRLDAQSAMGKAPAGVAARARAQGVPTVVIAGSILPGAEALYDLGAASLQSTLRCVASLEETLGQAGPWLEDAAERMFRLIALGQALPTRPTG